MKKLILFFVAFGTMCVSSFVASAQDQEVDSCKVFVSYYTEYYKQGTAKSREAALPSWRKALKYCQPNYRESRYSEGANLYRMMIAKNRNNAAYREALIDTLFTLHELRLRYFQNSKNVLSAYKNLSADINNYLKDKPAKAYELSSKVVEAIGNQADPVTFVAQMNAAVALFQDGKLTVEQVINDYDRAVAFFTEVQKVDTTQNTRNLRTTVENVFINSHVASCDNLIALFKDRYEASKNDVTEVKKIARLMSAAEDCTSNDLYLKAVTQMHKLEPSANSAYYLYRLYAGKKDITTAIKWLTEAISSGDLDDMTRAQYNYELAAFSLKNGHYMKTIEAANKAVSIDKTLSPKCNMLIGHAWMNVSCGGDEIESRAKFWVATDYFTRAKAADPELTEDANKLIATCRGYYPTKEEVFMHDINDGQSYTVRCGGMSATTTVKTK